MGLETIRKKNKTRFVQTANNWCINADCNGAANIIKKVSRKLGLDLSKLCRGALRSPTSEYIFGQRAKRRSNKDLSCCVVGVWSPNPYN